MISDQQVRLMHRAVLNGYDAGLEIPVDEINLALDGLQSEVLAKCVAGEATLEDVTHVVNYHWPDVLLDAWQVDLIRHLLSGQQTDLNELLIKGCTAAGKGCAVSLGACLWFQAVPACKVIITSQRHKHAHDVMYGEILKWRKRMRHSCPGDNGDTRIKTDEQKYIVTASPESGEGMSGQHGPATLFIFDEATACAEEFWHIATTQAALKVALSNPRTMSGWFRHGFPTHNLDKTQVVDILGGGRRFLLTVSGSDCLNVITGERRIPEQITRERYEGIMAHPNPRWSRVFGDGKFPEEDEDVLVVLPSWLDRHLDAWRADMHVVAFGLDVAASEHGDRTVLAPGGPGGCTKIHELQDVDTMRVVGWVIRVAKNKHGIELNDGGVPIVVDMDGLGKGVGDRLAELGCWVIEFRGNATSEADPKQYVNLRTEAYAELGRRLDPRGAWPDEPWALPRDSQLCEDLCAPERIYSSDGFKFRLTPKDSPGTVSSRSGFKGETIRQKLGRSPDRGDAVAYLYHGVREHIRTLDFRDRWDGDLIASGEDPVDENTPFTDDEVQELPDYLRDLVEGSRLQEKDRLDWEQEQGRDDW